MMIYKGALTTSGKFDIVIDIMIRINNIDADNIGNTNTIIHLIRRIYGFRNIKTII